MSVGFTSMFNSISSGFGSNSLMSDMASLYNLFAIIHIVLIVFMGMAAMLVMSLITSGSIAGVNGMAMGGVLAVGALAMSGLKKGGGMLNRQSLGRADQAIRNAGAVGSNAMAMGNNGFKALQNRFKTPLPHNGYAFAGGGGNGGGGGPKPSSMDPYLSSTNKLSGGAKEVSGYGDLGKGKMIKSSELNKDESSRGRSKLNVKAKGVIKGSYLSGEGGGSVDTPKDKPKRNFTKEQKRARKAYFAKKFTDSKGGDK